MHSSAKRNSPLLVRFSCLCDKVYETLKYAFFWIYSVSLSADNLILGYLLIRIYCYKKSWLTVGELSILVPWMLLLRSGNAHNLKAEVLDLERSALAANLGLYLENALVVEPALPCWGFVDFFDQTGWTYNVMLGKLFH